jgi:hypothetical protein
MLKVTVKLYHKNRVSCEIVTGDETCIYFFAPDSKRDSKVWIVEYGERPQVVQKMLLYDLFVGWCSHTELQPFQRQCSFQIVNPEAFCDKRVQPKVTGSKIWTVWRMPGRALL